MEITKDTPSGQITIAGHQISVPRPFNEGHVCTANEAGVLNQTLAENIRNNSAKKMNKAVEENTFDLAQAQKDVDAYVAGYEFGVRKGRGPADPVEREALEMAKGIVRDALKAKGFKLADIESTEITRLAEDAVEANPEITKEAKRRVETRAKLNLGDLGDIAVKEAAE